MSEQSPLPIPLRLQVTDEDGTFVDVATSEVDADTPALLLWGSDWEPVEPEGEGSSVIAPEH